MDAIFKALNDPTRRAILDALRNQDGQTVTDLEEQLEMTRFGVMKHLKVLEEAGLVVPVKRGRFKHHFLNAVPLQEVIDRWIEPLIAKPAARSLLSLKTQLEHPMTDRSSDAPRPDFVQQTFIRCSQDALWAALTEPDQAAAYNYVAARAERVGNRMTYFTADGAVMLICTFTEELPKTRIDSTFEPHWAGPDMPLAPSRFRYLIEPQGEVCLLTVEHYRIPDDQEGVREGWARTLAGLKTWLETGTAIKFASPPTSAAGA